MSYKFLTNTICPNVITKSDGGKTYYVTGYISVPEIDIQNDLVTPEAMESMLRQINESTITLDYDHEVWRDSSSILPVGKIVDAKIDSNGLWVKAELNTSSPKFNNLWGSIKGGFIKAFSIAFKPLKTVIRTVGSDKRVRLIQDLILLNVALTGAPVNKDALMTDFGMKSVMLKAIQDMEVKTMENKEEKKAEEDKKLKEEEMTKAEKKAEEDKQAADKEETKAEEDVEETKKKAGNGVENKSNSNAEILAQLKSMNEKINKQDELLNKIKDSPVMKSLTPQPFPEQKDITLKGTLGLIR